MQNHKLEMIAMYRYNNIIRQAQREDQQEGMNLLTSKRNDTIYTKYITLGVLQVVIIPKLRTSKNRKLINLKLAF